MSKNKDDNDIVKSDRSPADYSKAARQAAFLKSVEGLSVEEQVRRASLFPKFHRSGFKIIESSG